MEELIKWSFTGAALLLKFIIFLVAFKAFQATMAGFGALGQFVTKSRGQGVLKKAQDYREYRGNKRVASGRSLRRFQDNMRFNRDLKRQAADAGAKSRAAQYSVGNKHAQFAAKSNAQISAINNANNAQFAANVASGATNVSAGMSGNAAGNQYVQDALQAQQERAIAEAIKDVELSADIKPGDITTMANKLSEAIKNGNSIEARAYQNMLLKSGGAGISAFRGVMNGVSAADMTPDANGNLSKTGEAMQAIKQNMLVNHGGVKDSAADLIKFATEQNKTMGAVSGDAGTWKLSSEDLVKQKSASLKEAVAANGVSQQQAREIQDDDQLWRRLDKDGRDHINQAAGRVKP